MRIRTLPLVAVALLAAAANAAADPIRIVALSQISATAELDDFQSRHIVDNQLIGGGNNLAGAAQIAGTGFFASGVGTISSTIANGHASGAEVVRTAASSTDQSAFVLGEADSLLLIEFVLDRPHRFDYDAVITMFGEGREIEDPSIVHSLSSLAFTGDPDSPPIFDPIFENRIDDPHHEHHEGVLLRSGRYDLSLSLLALVHEPPEGSATAGATLSFTFDLTPTPEPTSVLLLGSGVMGLVAGRRRRSPLEC